MVRDVIHHVWSILCELSSIDQRTNNVSLFSVIEELKFTIGTPEPAPEGRQVVMVPFRAQLVTLWRRDSDADGDNAEWRIDFRSPKKSIRLSDPRPLRFSSLRMRTISDMPSVPVDVELGGPQEYQIDVQLNDPAAGGQWNVVYSYPLRITVATSLTS